MILRTSLGKLITLALCLTASASLSATTNLEPESRKFCVWDPIGSGGPVTRLARDAVPSAMSWGVDFQIDAYTDEKVAANDFKAGVCDAVMLTDVSIRDFNRFTGSFNAVGAITSEQELRTLMKTVTSPKAARLMINQNYEIAGIVPLGSVFVFVNDRSIDRMERFQGKKMAVLNDDNVAATMVRKVGGSVVPVSLTSLSGQFNNGNVDIIFAPAVAYNTMELYKGLEGGGGIIEYPLLHTSLQTVIHRDRFPEEFGQKMREYSYSKMDLMLDTVRQAEAEIPDDHWIRIAGEVQTNNNEYMRLSRISLKDKGYYEPKALSLMRKIRCKYSPTNSECVTREE